MEQRFEPGFTAQGIVRGMHTHRREGHFVGLAPAFQPVERLFDFAQAQVNHRITRRWNVALSGARFQPGQDAARPFPISG
jgi:hypothetical protein